MSDLLIRRAIPNANALIAAVGADDQAAVAEVLTDLDTSELHALAIVLASYNTPGASETDLLRAATSQAAHRFGIPEDHIRSTSRRREALDARAVAMYVGYLLGISYSAIGREIGRDHSTVIHAVTRVGETPRLRGIAHNIAELLGWDREAVA